MSPRTRFGAGVAAIVVDCPELAEMRNEFEAVGLGLAAAAASGAKECPPELDARRRALASQILSTYRQAIDYVPIPRSRPRVIGPN